MYVAFCRGAKRVDAPTEELSEKLAPGGEITDQAKVYGL